MSRPFSAFRANAREHRASILVAALSAAFGVALLASTGVLAAFIAGDDLASRHGSVLVALDVVAGVFFTIAVYVGAIVTTNTFATIIAGRTRTIALLRLIGSSARAQRRSVAGEGFVVGVIGAVAGGAFSATLALAAVRVFVTMGVLPDEPYPVLTPVLLAPLAIVVATTWLASWVGSRRVLTVTPVQALGASEERPATAIRGSRWRNAVAFALVVLGVALLVFGLLLGLGIFAATPIGSFTSYGVLIALPGGVLSFTGIILAAPLFMPPILRGVGLIFGRGTAARLAAANAVRNPERSSRTTIGLVIGVTLITMFVVASQSYLQMIHQAQENEPGMYAGVDSVLTATMAVFTVLIGFSAIIAAVGVVNSLSLSVLQRRRELGLLRALGFSATQVRRMILAESAQLTVASIVIGLVLGTVYGWIGAQALLGSIPGGGLLVPSLPWPFLGFIVLAAALLAVVASVAPTRRATSVAPVAALAVE
ncbi:ABC transporter permease [Leifsonia sp. NPDC058230]|uniref:ABC transporter permease n=1 Tax=Leifsonia sp. NPDC058230 TaxID=3346391 RepID=UPI0036DF0FC3